MSHRQRITSDSLRARPFARTLGATAALALVAAGCAGTGRAPAVASPDAPGVPGEPANGEPLIVQLGQASWTPAFGEEAFLLAETIVVEGPPGLLEHVVLQQNELAVDYSARSLGNALQQELRVKPGSPAQARGHLDHWTLVAEQRLTIRQSDADVPVLVRAEGNAVWRAVQSGEVQRGRNLEFVGRR